MLNPIILHLNLITETFSPIYEDGADVCLQCYANLGQALERHDRREANHDGPHLERAMERPSKKQRVRNSPPSEPAQFEPRSDVSRTSEKPSAPAPSVEAPSPEAPPAAAAQPEIRSEKRGTKRRRDPQPGFARPRPFGFGRRKVFPEVPPVPEDIIPDVPEFKSRYLSSYRQVLEQVSKDLHGVPQRFTLPARPSRAGWVQARNKANAAWSRCIQLQRDFESRISTELKNLFHDAARARAYFDHLERHEQYEQERRRLRQQYDKQRRRYAMVDDLLRAGLSNDQIKRALAAQKAERQAARNRSTFGAGQKINWRSVWSKKTF